MTRDTRSRARRIREAILDDLETAAGQPLLLGELTSAAAIAASRQEVYVQTLELMKAGLIERHGDGYQAGEPYSFTLT